MLDFSIEILPHLIILKATESELKLLQYFVLFTQSTQCHLQ